MSNKKAKAASESKIEARQFIKLAPLGSEQFISEFNKVLQTALKEGNMQKVAKIAEGSQTLGKEISAILDSSALESPMDSKAIELQEKEIETLEAQIKKEQDELANNEEIKSLRAKIEELERGYKKRISDAKEAAFEAQMQIWALNQPLRDSITSVMKEIEAKATEFGLPTAMLVSVDSGLMNEPKKASSVAVSSGGEKKRRGKKSLPVLIWETGSEPQTKLSFPTLNQARAHVWNLNHPGQIPSGANGQACIAYIENNGFQIEGDGWDLASYRK